jgi:hypothetical protein
MLQFGGHHLALNIAMSGGKGLMVPSLTGAQPAKRIDWIGIHAREEADTRFARKGES